MITLLVQVGAALINQYILTWRAARRAPAAGRRSVLDSRGRMDRAASSAEHFAHGSRDARWTPPDQYGLVESQVYRSAFLTPASFDFINLLNLRTVVNLSQEVPVRAVLSFFQENHITLENVGLQVWTSMAFAPITQELIKEALQHVLDVSRHPLLLMSSSGTHQVGVLVGCLRRQQSWNLASILDEYRSFASPSARLNCEQFIELWDTVPLRSLKAGPARGAAPRQPRHPSLLARATSAPDCSAPSGERGREPQRGVVRRLVLWAVCRLVCRLVCRSLGPRRGRRGSHHPGSALAAAAAAGVVGGGAADAARRPGGVGGLARPGCRHGEQDLAEPAQASVGGHPALRGEPVPKARPEERAGAGVLPRVGPARVSWHHHVDGR